MSLPRISPKNENDCSRGNPNYKKSKNSCVERKAHWQLEMLESSMELSTKPFGVEEKA
jgi:hypothetical protein